MKTMEERSKHNREIKRTWNKLYTNEYIDERQALANAAQLGLFDNTPSQAASKCSDVELVQLPSPRTSKCSPKTKLANNIFSWRKMYNHDLHPGTYFFECLGTELSTLLSQTQAGIRQRTACAVRCIHAHSSSLQVIQKDPAVCHGTHRLPLGDRSLCPDVQKRWENRKGNRGKISEENNFSESLGPN